MLLPYLLLAAYLLAVNLYAFLWVRTQRRAAEGRARGRSGNARLLLAGLLGGALGGYIAMLALRFKTDHLLPMLLLPLMIVLNGYLVYALVRGGWAVLR